ncbi:hypothetical protein Q8A72_09715 [Aeribacillus pallidus]|nr:hypothetical protein [Aeribacillus pallidus]
MKMVFIFLCLLGMFYFVIKKRHFDFFSIAFFSTLIYFMPGFFGYVLEPASNFYQPIITKTYFIMILVIIFIIITAILFDFMYVEKKINLEITGINKSVYVIVFLALIGFILSLITIGPQLFSPDKGVILENINRWQLLWVTSSIIGCIVSYLQKKKLLFVICLILLLIDMYVGFRVNLAITLIALLVIKFSKGNYRTVLIKKWKWILSGLLVSILFFIYKPIYRLVKIGDWGTIKHLLTDVNFYLYSLSKSEPFYVQTILNEINRLEYHIGLSHFQSIIYQFILFAPQLGAEIKSFNSIFQSQLFPSVTWGMANNIWAEMISSGGFPLLLFFLLIFCFFIYIGNYYFLSIDTPMVKGTLSIILTYFTFYIHRNELLYIVNLSKRIFIIVTIGALVSMMFSQRKYYKNKL